jgi:hypothetical protein
MQRFVLPGHLWTLDGHASALIVVETQPLASALFVQNTVLFVKTLDDVLLLLI